MKPINRRYLALLVAGSFLMSISLTLEHYIVLTDTVNGFIKGVALGLMLLSLLLTSRERRRKTLQ